MERVTAIVMFFSENIKKVESIYNVFQQKIRNCRRSQYQNNVSWYTQKVTRYLSLEDGARPNGLFVVFYGAIGKLQNQHPVIELISTLGEYNHERGYIPLDAEDNSRVEFDVENGLFSSNEDFDEIIVKFLQSFGAKSFVKSTIPIASLAFYNKILDTRNDEADAYGQAPNFITLLLSGEYSTSNICKDSLLDLNHTLLGDYTVVICGRKPNQLFTAFPRGYKTESDRGLHSLVVSLTSRSSSKNEDLIAAAEKYANFVSNKLTTAAINVSWSQKPILVTEVKNGNVVHKAQCYIVFLLKPAANGGDGSEYVMRAVTDLCVMNLPNSNAPHKFPKKVMNTFHAPVICTIVQMIVAINEKIRIIKREGQNVSKSFFVGNYEVSKDPNATSSLAKKQFKYLVEKFDVDLRQAEIRTTSEIHIEKTHASKCMQAAGGMGMFAIYCDVNKGSGANAFERITTGIENYFREMESNVDEDETPIEYQIEFYQSHQALVIIGCANYLKTLHEGLENLCHNLRLDSKSLNAMEYSVSLWDKENDEEIHKFINLIPFIVGSKKMDAKHTSFEYLRTDSFVKNWYPSGSTEAAFDPLYDLWSDFHTEQDTTGLVYEGLIVHVAQIFKDWALKVYQNSGHGISVTLSKNPVIMDFSIKLTPKTETVSSVGSSNARQAIHSDINDYNATKEFLLEIAAGYYNEMKLYFSLNNRSPVFVRDSELFLFVPKYDKSVDLVVRWTAHPLCANSNEDKDYVVAMNMIMKNIMIAANKVFAYSYVANVPGQNGQGLRDIEMKYMSIDDIVDDYHQTITRAHAAFTASMKLYKRNEQRGANHSKKPSWPRCFEGVKLSMKCLKNAYISTGGDHLSMVDEFSPSGLMYSFHTAGGPIYVDGVEVSKSLETQFAQRVVRGLIQNCDDHSVVMKNITPNVV